MARLTFGLAALSVAALLTPTVRAQAVAFQPVVSAFPDGVMMSATPVVSADRRYVRLGVNPQFTALNGFENFAVPAAVSGGPGGFLPGGFAGLGGPGTGVAPPARSAAPAPAAAGGRSSSDPFQAALAQYANEAQPEARRADARAGGKSSRRRDIIRKRR